MATFNKTDEKLLLRSREAVLFVLWTESGVCVRVCVNPHGPEPLPVAHTVPTSVLTHCMVQRSQSTVQYSSPRTIYVYTLCVEEVTNYDIDCSSPRRRHKALSHSKCQREQT